MRSDSSLKPEEAPLLRLIQQEDAALFIGSGISTWSGLPSWQRLIQALIEECQTLGGRVSEAETALSKGDLLGAAEQVCTQMSSSEIARTLRHKLQFSKAQPHEIHKLIFSLGIRRFITTNYDDLLEQIAVKLLPASKLLTVTSRHIAELADIQKASANNFIFKPHGDLGDAEGLVIAETHYRRIFLDADSSVRQALETIFVSRPILFLGYGLRDPDLIFILRTLRSRYRGNAGDLWAIMPNITMAQADGMWADFRIRAISYQAEANHKDLLRILRGLIAGRTNRSKSNDRTIGSSYRAFDIGLARYAARLVAPAVPLLPVRARLPWGFNPLDERSTLRSFDGLEVRHILQHCDTDFIIQGPAGSGKSLSVTRFVSDCAKSILEHLAETKNFGAYRQEILPVRLNCQAYDGDFEALLRVSVPPLLDLSEADGHFKIVLIVDSIDEMPVQFLESQSWSRDLAEMKSRWKDTKTVYISRRRDLIPNSALPVFVIQPLPDEIIENELSAISVELDDLPSSLIDELRTPYVLEMYRKVTPGNPALRNAFQITEIFIQDALARLPRSHHLDHVFAALSSIGAWTLRRGRETFEYAAFLKLTRSPGGRSDSQGIADRLIEVGILRSETDRRLRFSHRVLTEYFASRWIALHWEERSFSLRESSSAVHLHNPLVWAAVFMSSSDRERYFDSLLALDIPITCQIASSIELDRGQLWSRIFQKMTKNPPGQELALDLSHDLVDVPIPDEALVDLEPLARGSELSGWALTKLIPKMEREKLETLLDECIDGKIDWNALNWAGHSLGQRIDSSMFHKLKDALVLAARSSEVNSKDTRRFALETIIGGLPSELLEELFRWSERRSPSIRGILVRAVSDAGTLESEKFILRQWDHGVPEATFALYINLKYDHREWNSPIPRPTPVRISRVLDGLLLGQKSEIQWRVSLLRTLVERDPRWRDAVRRSRAEQNDRRLASIISLLLPGRQATRLFRQRVQTALRKGKPLSEIEKALFHAYEDKEPSLLFDENQLLASFDRHGAVIWEIAGIFLTSHSSKPHRLVVTQVDRWLDGLSTIKFAACDDFLFDQLAAFVATNLSKEARERVLARANNPTDKLSTFILLEIVRRMQTVTTDDLTNEAGGRLIREFFNFEYEGEPFPTPGSIATESFVSKTILPYLRSINRNKIGDDIERTLKEAGERHGLIYRLD